MNKNIGICTYKILEIQQGEQYHEENIGNE